MSNSFYVYVYRDTAGNPFYVGKGKGGRYKYHPNDCQNSKDSQYRTHFYTKLRKMARLGEEFTFEIFKGNLLESEAFEWEKFLIAFWGRRDIKTGCLCNHTDGGEGASGSKHSDEHKAKISKSLLNLPKEVRARISKVISKPIIALDIDTGEDLIEFSSIADAGRFFGITPETIGSVLKGRILTAASCRWKYLGKDELPIQEALEKKSKAYKKPVVALDITGKDLMEFDSATDAAIFLDCSVCAINNTLRGKSKTSAGCKWRYA